MMHKLIKQVTTLGAMALLSSGCAGGAEGSSTGGELTLEDDNVPVAPAGAELTYVPGGGDELAPTDEALMQPGEASLASNDDSAGVELAPPAPTEQEMADVQAAADEVASTQQALFNGKCKSARIKVHNTATIGGQQLWIRIQRFKYYDLTSGVKRSEDVVDGQFFTGQSLLWDDEDLEETKNHRVGSWIIYYQFAFPGESWSGTVKTEVIPFDGYGEECKTDELFEMNLGQ